MTEPTADPKLNPAGSTDTTPPKPPSFEQRIESFGQQAGAAGERIGRQAEAAGERLAQDPTVQRAADTAARGWGLIVLAVGVWFLADLTIGLDMPNVPWGDIWPLGLILIGGLIVVRGMGRRSA